MHMPLTFTKTAYSFYGLIYVGNYIGEWRAVDSYKIIVWLDQEAEKL